VIKSSLLNTYSWDLTSNLTFNPFLTFSNPSQNLFSKYVQQFDPAGQSTSVANEIILSNSKGIDYLIACGYNSSGYFGTTNLGNRYGYIYNASTDLRIFNKNGSSVDTAILLSSGNLNILRDIIATSKSLTIGSISSTSINSNNNTITAGTSTISANNFIGFSTASNSAYFPNGLYVNNVINMSNFKITNLATPTTSTDAANKTYVDSKSTATNMIINDANLSGISDGVIIVRGLGGTADVRTSIDNGQSSLLWNGWGRCGFKGTHPIQTFEHRMVLSNDRFAIIHGNANTSGRNAGAYLSEWYYYNTLRCYVSNGGTFINSDKNIKWSLRNKCDNMNNKNYLERILKLPIYSYAFNNCDDDHCNSEINIGPMYQDVKEIFNNNCVGNRKYLENYKCKEDCGTCKRRKEYYGDEVKCINNNEIMYYHILGFKEYVNKTDEKIKNLEEKYNDLENKFNILLEKLNISI
jgi:hypothetical protein